MTFAKGTTVNIINMTMTGRFICEGRATIVRAVPDVDSQYIVRFAGEKQTVERFVDPNAQDDLEACLAALNKPLDLRLEMLPKTMRDLA